jgi:hypothetical protein
VSGIGVLTIHHSPLTSFDAPQPGRLLGFILIPKLGDALVSFQQSLLDDAGEFEIALEALIELQPGKQIEIFSVFLQRPIRLTGRAG